MALKLCSFLGVGYSRAKLVYNYSLHSLPEEEVCLHQLSAGVFSAASSRNSNSNWLNKKEFYFLS